VCITRALTSGLARRASKEERARHQIGARPQQNPPPFHILMSPKSLLLITFALLVNHTVHAQAPGAAQPPPPQTPGFLDLPWASNAEFIKKQFTARTHAHFDKPASSNDELQFSGGKFAGFTASRFSLHLASDRLWKADVVFDAVSKDHKKEFASLRQLLVEKYGPPTSDSKHDQDLVAEWYLSGLPGVDKDKICLDTDVKGSGMKLFYAADRIARVAIVPVAPPATDAANKAKPLSVSPKAKDDL
jgi:hypothetical protein